MKIVPVLIACLFSLQLSAQNGNFYVALKAGLSIRERPDVNAKVIDRIPYGTRISIPAIDNENEAYAITLEGMSGIWRKLTYNGHPGFIVGMYLFPWPPPRVGIKDMAGYFSQCSVPFGQKLITKNAATGGMEQDEWELEKQLYKNGAEHHVFHGYEGGSDTWFFPGFDLQQGFLLLRLLPEFKNVFTERDIFPTKSATVTKNNLAYTITVDSEITEGLAPYIRKIHIEWEDEATFVFEMYQIDNQLVVFFGSGV